jgi:hypothetical protein
VFGSDKNVFGKICHWFEVLEKIPAFIRTIYVQTKLITEEDPLGENQVGIHHRRITLRERLASDVEISGRFRAYY